MKVLHKLQDNPYSLTSPEGIWWDSLNLPAQLLEKSLENYPATTPLVVKLCATSSCNTHTAHFTLLHYGGDLECCNLKDNLTKLKWVDFTHFHNNIEQFDIVKLHIVGKHKGAYVSDSTSSYRELSLDDPYRWQENRHEANSIGIVDSLVVRVPKGETVYVYLWVKNDISKLFEA